MTTSQNILDFSDKCDEQHKKNIGSNSNKKVVFLFDEISLAEIGYDNALKCLHPILEPPAGKPRNYSFVAISNWMLDLSKMSRAIFIPRPDPEVKDLAEIINSKEIEKLTNVDFKNAIKKIVEVLPQTYLDFVENEG